jgi:hypothetical protein
MERKEINLNDNEGILVFDHKECWNTRTFLAEETSWDHWHPNGISHIAYVLTWKEKGKKQKRVYNYLSTCKKHDTKFTTQTLMMVMKEEEIKYLAKIDLFCDVGPHFYNKYLLHQVFNTPLLGARTVSLTYFAEHHGKSHCDSAFGTLSQAIRQCLPLPNVQSCGDLVSFFNNLKGDHSTCFQKIKEEFFFKEYVHNIIYYLYIMFMYI